jgi:hypothetical protein
MDGQQAFPVNVVFAMGPRRPNPPAPQVVTGLQNLALAVLGPGSTVKITSGLGEYGGPRHRGGLAADATFIDPQGNTLSLSDPRARALALAAPSHGFMGFGAGNEYMGDTSFHLDMFPVDQYTPDMAQTWGSFGRDIRDEFVAASQGIMPQLAGTPADKFVAASQGIMPQLASTPAMPPASSMASNNDQMGVPAIGRDIRNEFVAASQGIMPQPAGTPAMAHASGMASNNNQMGVPAMSRPGLMNFMSNEQEGGGAFYQNPDFMDQVAMSLAGLSTRPNQALIEGAQQRIAMREQGRQEAAQRGQTLQWLASQGRDDLVAAVTAGLPVTDAMNIALMPAQAPEQTSAMQNYEFLLAQGVEPQAAIEQAFGGNGVTVQMPGQPMIGPIPADYQAIMKEDGTYEFVAIPGSRAYEERQAAQAAEQATGQAKLTAGQIVLDEISRIKSLTESGAAITGLVGSIASAVPGTPAHDVKGMINTIKANIGFDQLNAMRKQSPTGAALGNVTVVELQFLQSVLGDLEQSRSKEAFLYNLNRLENVYNGIINGTLDISRSAAQQSPSITTTVLPPASSGITLSPEALDALGRYSGN